MLQAGVNNTPSSIDLLYQKGLSFYWGGYYKKALAKFEEVKRIYPTHPEVSRLIQISKAKQTESHIYWPSYSLYFYIWSGIAALFILLLILWTFASRVVVHEENQAKALKKGESNAQGVLQTASEQLKQKHETDGNE
jgi:hypothetical protein